MSEMESAVISEDHGSDRLVRHEFVDRLLHWTMAVSVIVLLVTAFFPIVGIEFAWVTVHWIAGIVLAVLALAHIVRSLFWQDLMSMWIGSRDLRDGIQLLRWTLRLSALPPALGGKYSLAQKAIHHVFAIVVLTTVVTGSLMLVKIDTPWWERDPYWLGEDTWGTIYVLHDLAALLLVAMVMTHIYFALRPEKLFFTRAMLVGWITRAEHAAHHDPERWRAEPE